MIHEHLVIMDMQEAFIQDKDPDEVRAVGLVIQCLIERFRSFQSPITVTMFPEKKFGPLMKDILPVRGSEIVVKNHSDAFLSSQFRSRLERNQPLHLCGCHVDVCIRLTVESALKNHHPVVVYRNAVLQRAFQPNKNIHTWVQFFLDPRVRIRFFSHP